MAKESDSLLGGSGKKGRKGEGGGPSGSNKKRGSSFYFIEQSTKDSAAGQDAQGDEGYRTRKIMPRSRLSRRRTMSGGRDGSNSGVMGRLKRFLLGGREEVVYGGQGALKQRVVPIKVEPKVFFALERTFLAWMHTGVTLGSIGLGIVLAANGDNAIYGLVLVAISIVFILYSLSNYISRTALIRAKAPGPYEDVKGVCAMAAVMCAGIAINGGIKIYDMINRDDDNDAAPE